MFFFSNCAREFFLNIWHVFITVDFFYLLLVHFEFFNPQRNIFVEILDSSGVDFTHLECFYEGQVSEMEQLITFQIQSRTELLEYISIKNWFLSKIR